MICGKQESPVHWIAAADFADMKDAANLMAYYETITEDADPSETYQLFGKPPTSLNDWCMLQKKKSRHL